jgi:tetratricopeptide (TPR) repeat protein
VKERLHDTHLSRRGLLTGFAHLSQTLTDRLDEQLPEQADAALLGQYHAVITACWQWSKGSDFFSIEQTLPFYLHKLEQIRHVSPKYAQKAAYLLAQGYTLRGTVAFHRGDLLARADFCRLGVQWARQAADPTLLVATLATCGATFRYTGQPEQAIQTYQEAMPMLNQASPLAQTSLLIKLAEAYAQLGQKQEAEQSLSRAYKVFPAHPWEDDAALFADCGEPSICLWDGLTHLALSRTASADDRTARLHLRHTWDMLDLYGGTHPPFVVSERNHVEILVHQAATAVALDDMDLFTSTFADAVTAMKALGSQRRRQEAVAVYWQARKRWPHEIRISDLAELFL